MVTKFKTILSVLISVLIVTGAAYALEMPVRNIRPGDWPGVMMDLLWLENRLNKIGATETPAGEMDIEDGDSEVVANADVIDFAGVEFTVTESPAGEANVAVGAISADKIADGSTNAIPTLTQETNWDTHLTSDGTDHTYIDQDVQTTANPTWAGVNSSGDIIPTADNANALGTAAKTWATGRFTDLTIDSGLNVGSATGAALGDIKSSDGTRTFEWDASAADLKLGADGVAETDVYMYSDDAGKYLRLRSIGSSGQVVSTGTSLVLEGTAVGIKAGAVYPIYATSTPRVGINDTSPSYTLDVNGTGRFVDIMRFDEDVILTADKEIYPGTHGHGKIGTANHFGEGNFVALHAHTLDVGDASNKVKKFYPASMFQPNEQANNPHVYRYAGSTFWTLVGGGWSGGGLYYFNLGLDLPAGTIITEMGISGFKGDAADTVTAQLQYQWEGAPTLVGNAAVITTVGSWSTDTESLSHTIVTNRFCHIEVGISVNDILARSYVEGVWLEFSTRKY